MPMKREMEVLKGMIDILKHNFSVRVIDVLKPIFNNKMCYSLNTI